MKIEFTPKPAKRLFRRCRICGAEWPNSVEYCRRCTVWLGPTDSTEDILWYMPADGFQTGVTRYLNGIYEATVLTVAACDGIYAGRSNCPALLEKVAGEMTISGGIITKGPGGHLAVCFINRNLIEAATRAVERALSVQSESKQYGLRTFLGINTGPVLLGALATQPSPKARREISGGTVGCSERLAFSLDPQMIVLSPSTFKLVASRFECYGTEPLNLWGTLRNDTTTVYVLSGPKKVTSRIDRLDDDSVPLIGRKRELALIRRYWKKTKSGKMAAGLTVRLVGEPGTGKSRLLQTFLADIKEADPDTVLIKLAGANYGGRPGLLVEEFAGECLRKGILSAETMPDSRSRSLLPRIRLVSQLLIKLNSLGPALIVMDDVHWADRASVRVFQKAFSSLPARIMVIVSYRPSGSRLAELLQSTPAIRIDLGPLNEGQARKISKLQSKERHWVSGPVWDDIWKKSKGNAFYVEEATKLFLTRTESRFGEACSEPDPRARALPGTRAGLLAARIREWSGRELNTLQREIGLRWGLSLHARLNNLEIQINDWLDRLETQGYLERIELAKSLEELEQFEDRVVEICLAGGLGRPFTTRLKEAVSRLYEGNYEEHYRYLRQYARTGINVSRIGYHALRVAGRAAQTGKLREAERFLLIADEMLPADHPARTDVLEDKGDVNLYLGRPANAITSFQKALSERDKGNPHRRDIVHKLVAARVLQGDRIEPEVCECGAHPCPWHLALTGVGALLSQENETAISFAEKARDNSRDWVTRSCADLVEALARLGTGEREKSVMLCRQAAETMEEGGFSLLSLWFHWVLSQVERGPLHKRHVSTGKSITRNLGVSSGLRAFESRFDRLTNRT